MAQRGALLENIAFAMGREPWELVRELAYLLDPSQRDGRYGNTAAWWRSRHREELRLRWRELQEGTYGQAVVEGGT